MAAPAASAAASVSASALSEWLDAARAGLWNPLGDLLARGAVSVDTQESGTGRTALLICAEEGHADCVAELLRAGARIDLADAAGQTALMLAAEAGAVACMHLLFEAAENSTEQEIDVNAQDHRGETAVLKAVRAQELAAVQALVEYEEQRCDLELANDAGDTPLLVAVAAAPASAGASTKDEPALAVVQFLLSNPRTRVRPAGYNKRTGLSALHLAVLGGKLDALRLLVAAKGTDLDRQDLDRFESEPGEDDDEDHGAAASQKAKQPDLPKKKIAGGNTALHLAVSEPDLPLDFLKAMLPLCNAGAPATPASPSTSNAAVPTLCRKNNSGYTALHLAVRNSNVPAVELLLSAEADLMKSAAVAAGAQGSSASGSSRLPSTSVLDGEFGWSALQHAAAKGDKDVVKAFCVQVDNGVVDVNATDRRGSSALQLAARFGHLSCVKYLVKSRANLRAADAAGSTALMDCLVNGHAAIAAFLLEKGAPVTQKDLRGGHALHRMAEKVALTPAAVDAARKVLEQHVTDPATRAALVHDTNSEGETSWSLSRARAAESSGGLAGAGAHAALASWLSGWAASAPPPPVGEVTSVNAAGDGTLVVAFRPHKNAAFMLAELSYEATAVPALMPTAAEAAAAPAKSATSKSKDKPVASASKKPKDASSSSAASAAPSTPVKIAEPKVRTASTKKPASTKKASSSSSSKLREAAVTSAVPSAASLLPSQSARGSFSPLRIGGLINGAAYSVSVVSVTARGGSSTPALWQGGVPVVVGTPEPPVITQVVQGSTWASISFMPASGGRNAASSSTGAVPANTQSAVQEFILTATVHTSNPRHTAPASSLAAMTAAATAGSASSTAMRRVISAVSSPILLTNLAPGLTYSLTLRARNGFGEGAPTQPKQLTVAGAQGAVSAAQSASAPVVAAVAAEKHLMWLTPSVDAAELSECQALLSQAMTAELQSLLKQSRQAAASAAAVAGVSSPVSPISGSVSVAGINAPGSEGLRIMRAAKLSNAALSAAFDGASSFMQALGCPRADSTRTQWAFVLLEGGARGQAQLDSIAVHGLLPWAHPLSAAFVPSNSATAVSSTPADPAYNPNVFPVGSPYRGVYASLHVSRALLLAASGAAAAANDAASVHRVVICKVLPGRSCGAAATDAATLSATAAIPAVNAKPARPSSARPSSASGRPSSGASAAAPVSAVAAGSAALAVQSTAWDSHQSPSGASLFLYSGAQVLPQYAVEFALPAGVLSGALFVGAASLSAEEAQLERDALEQGGVLVGEAAPMRADPLAELRNASTSDASAQKWMGSAPPSALLPPGGGAPAAHDAPLSSAATATRSRGDDDEGEVDADGDQDEEERLDISQAQSSLLGPRQPKPSEAAAASKRRI